MDKQKGVRKPIGAYRGVVFDLDGTIVDLGVDWTALKKQLSEYVLKKTGQRFTFTPLDQQLFRARTKFGETFFRRLLEIVTSHELTVDRHVFFDDVNKFIHTATDQKLAVYSMNTERCVRTLLENKFPDKFSVVIAKETCSGPKPTGADLQKILQYWGVNSNDVLFVGDTENDKKSAELARVSFLTTNEFRSIIQPVTSH